jgi:subtilisin family serine protease
MSGLTMRSLIAALAASALVAISPLSATADTADDGLWYFTTFHVQDAHDAGFTGKGVTIAVIDGAINLEVPTLAGADIEVMDQPCYDRDGVALPTVTTDIDRALHGTNVVSYIVGNGKGYGSTAGIRGVAPDARVLFYTWGSSQSGPSGIACGDADGTEVIDTHISQAIDDAVARGADIISMSFALLGQSDLAYSVAKAQHAGVILVAGVGNQTLDITGPYPAGMNGVVAVQALQPNGKIASQSKVEDVPGVNPLTDVTAPGADLLLQGVGGDWEQQLLWFGTSLSTPIVSSYLAVAKQKFPQATANQLIQLLLVNTGTEDHELLYDESQAYGYGIASLTHMLASDPSVYPDVNPLIGLDRKINEPTADQIANPPATLDDYIKIEIDGGISTSPPNTEGADSTTALVIAAIVGGIVLFVVIVIVIVVVVVVSRRRPRAPRQ